MEYVIIGNSAGGIGTVEGIRQIDKQGGIKIITDEPYHTYSRPLISYYLKGKVNEDRMKYREDDFYIKNNVKFLSNVKAIDIDKDDRNVILNDNTRVRYDKLLIAAGSSAFVPPFKGLDTVEQKFSFMSLADAIKLENVVDYKNVLVIGAGLIGLKCAEGILNRTSSIIVLDLAPRILSSILDEEGAKIVQDRLEEHGVHFKLSCGVERFSGNIAELNDGSKIDFDILVLASGVRANTALLDGITETDKGIIINEKCETSCPNIYAAGDCTQSVDISSGQSKIMALLPNAYMQGECAGINMAGGDRKFSMAIPMNSIGFFGLNIITAGTYEGDVFTVKKGMNQYKKLFYKDDRLSGFILIGDIDKAGIYTSLVRERTPLSEVDFGLICEKPGLMAFSREERNRRLGSAL